MYSACTCARVVVLVKAGANRKSPSVFLAVLVPAMLLAAPKAATAKTRVETADFAKWVVMMISFKKVNKTSLGMAGFINLGLSSLGDSLLSLRFVDG